MYAFTQDLQDSIPDSFINKTNQEMFSSMPENMQMETIQKTIIETLSFMVSANTIGVNFLISLISAIAALNNKTELLTKISEIEQKINENENRRTN